MFRRIFEFLKSFGKRRQWKNQWTEGCDRRFVGEVPLNIESVTIHAKTRKLQGPLPTVEISQMGWPIYRINGYRGISSQAILDERNWPRNSDGTPALTTFSERPHPGQRVIWKGNVFDYLWNSGVIAEVEGRLYVESDQSRGLWGCPEFSQEAKCWVTYGANYTPSRESLIVT